MRYKLDANGYVIAVFWGCHSGDCVEYTGTVPYGYTDLNDWSENALINAYYIENGNLVLDPDKLAELEAKIELETIDNEPLLYKDLYGTSNVLEAQYQNAIAKGEVIAIDNVKKINPKAKITDIKCYESSKIDIITQGKQMLRNDAKTETISGVNFYRNPDGTIRISGTSTETIEYNLSGGENNFTPLFALKQNENYYLNIGDLECEMKFYDGTTSQVYTGASGLINLSESKAVTQVLIKIPANETLDAVIQPMLNYGDVPSEYESYKERRLTLDFSEYVEENPLFPSDTLYPSDDLYPRGSKIELYIEDGQVYVYVNGIKKHLCKANVNLYDGFNTVYTMQESTLDMTYCIDVLDVESLEFLQGKATTTNKFKILKDGSIEAHNGYFSGTIEADNGYFKGKVEANSGEVGGWRINGTQLYCEIKPPYDYAQSDLDKLQSHLQNGTSLTNEERIKYDVNSDGILNTKDLLRIQKLINYNLMNSRPGKLIFDTSDWFNPIKVINGDGVVLSSFGVHGVYTIDSGE